MIDLRLGDCLDVMRNLPDCSVDAVVTDPPYGLSFMGKRWDCDVPTVEVWAECLRVLKPGGHLLAFAGTRTQHRMAVRIEDAGFGIRDMIAWVYGEGFNKVGYVKDGSGNHALPGFGGSLKPSLEPITLARKPFNSTVAANVLEHGTGGLNIDGCRVGDDQRYNPAAANKPNGNSLNMSQVGMPEDAEGQSVTGRWPANLILTYPEDEYKLRDKITPQQLVKLAEWMNENS
jgi:site-specific DNA-methyltransferase (adenine-specific)